VWAGAHSGRQGRAARGQAGQSCLEKDGCPEGIIGQGRKASLYMWPNGPPGTALALARPGTAWPGTAN
jgi:hypothetical protein